MSSRRHVLVLAALIALILLAVASPALAGPGGFVAKAITKSWWGKLGLALLFVVFLPLIAWMWVTEWVAVRRSLRDLRRLAARDRRFQLLLLKQRATECFHRVHHAWSREDMAQASAYMTDWYWQNQQLAHIERWEREGLVNHCRIESVGRIRPLHVEASIVGGQVTNARVVLGIRAKMEDYLAERATGRVVEGEKGVRSVETTWTFLLDGDALRVSQIEEDTATLDYARQPNLILEETAAAALASR